MNKLLLLLSFVVLLFVTSCEDDLVGSLAGTEWHKQPCVGDEVEWFKNSIIKFGETTFERESEMIDWDGVNVVSRSTGTYVYDGYSVVLVSKSVFTSRAVIAHDQMVFGLNNTGDANLQYSVLRYKRQ